MTRERLHFQFSDPAYKVDNPGYYYVSVYSVKFSEWLNLKMKNNVLAGSVPGEDFYLLDCSLCVK